MDWIDRWILYWVRESTLWPILLVLIGHAVAFVGPLMIWSVREGDVGSGVTLVALAVGTVLLMRVEIRARKRPGALAGLLLSTWALTGLCAWGAARSGIF